MSETITPATYQSYRGLPTLAGLATLEEAARPGLSVEACVARLKRYHYAFLRLHEIFTARITAEPIYELKTGFSHHAYLCAEHVAGPAHARRRDARAAAGPGGGARTRRWQVFFDEILAAPTTAELLVGPLRGGAAGARRGAGAAHRRHQPADRRPVACASAALPGWKSADMIEFGGKCLDCLVDDARLARHDAVAGTARRLPGRGRRTGRHRRAVRRSRRARGYSAKPYVYDPVPRRDERFQDLWNQGVNAESFLYNPDLPPRPKTLMMLFKRLREIDVPEMMASIITQTKGKPWGYYRDMTRQLWDEARHAMMGEVGFVALGIDWTQARITHNWSHAPQHRMHAAGAPRGALLHRAGADDADRQALRVGGRRRVGRSR